MGAILVAVFGVAGAARVAAAAPNDDRIENTVDAKLSQDARFKAAKVKVDVEDGVATLKGKVASEADRVRAARLAAACEGVVRVDNQLEVDTGVAKDRIEENADRSKEAIDENARRTKERTDDNAKRARDRVDQRAEAAKDDVDRGRTEPNRARDTKPREDGAGTEITDSWITTKVKAEMMGVDALKGSDVHVDTNHDGTVTLTGTVPNETARARAVEIARAVKGVQRVVDELRLARRR
jgi:osmotically-inducible protein OsmY